MYADQRNLSTATTPQHAIAPLIKGVLDRDALIVLTGAAGCGKSAVLEQALQAIAQDEIRIIRISNPGPGTLGPRQLMAQVLGGESPNVPSGTYIGKVLAELCSQYGRGGQTVLAIDDAETLTQQALDYLQLVANHVATRQSGALQIILAGRPALRERLQQPACSGLRGFLGTEVTLERPPLWQRGAPPELPGMHGLGPRHLAVGLSVIALIGVFALSSHEVFLSPPRAGAVPPPPSRPKLRGPASRPLLPPLRGRHPHRRGSRPTALLPPLRPLLTRDPRRSRRRVLAPMATGKASASAAEPAPGAHEPPTRVGLAAPVQTSDPARPPPAPDPVMASASPPLMATHANPAERRRVGTAATGVIPPAATDWKHAGRSYRVERVSMGAGAAQPKRPPADQHCHDLRLRIQLGEEPTDADRSYLRVGCKAGD